MASVNGGTQPRWRNDGNELYYIEGEAIVTVSVATESGFTLGCPQRLLEDPSLTTVGTDYGAYDVSAGGQRLVMTAPVEADGEQTAPPVIRIVLNWYEEFRDWDWDWDWDRDR